MKAIYKAEKRLRKIFQSETEIRKAIARAVIRSMKGPQSGTKPCGCGRTISATKAQCLACATSVPELAAAA